MKEDAACPARIFPAERCGGMGGLKDGESVSRWILESAARQGNPVGFYGAAPGVMAGLLANIRLKLPDLKIEPASVPLP